MSDTVSELRSTIGWIGGLTAAGLSYAVNHSFWYAVLHFFCSYFYVAYWLAFHLPHYLR